MHGAVRPVCYLVRVMAQVHASECACMHLRGDIAALFPKRDVHPAGGRCWARTQHSANGTMTHRG